MSNRIDAARLLPIVMGVALGSALLAALALLLSGRTAGDLVRKREQTAELAAKAESLNEKRKKVFGGSELALIANERVRTEHNCIARDVISVAGHLLFGFQVFMGLKTETSVGDVFAFYKFNKLAAASSADGSEEWDLGQLPFEGPGAFLADEAFGKELRDTFKYAKEGRLLRLKRTDTRLLAVVLTGATIQDAKGLRWAIVAGGRVS